ncbi:hypothetical protein [Mucilaginibacter sp. SP1R1]|uniref:hypothetical protein n=1 Tax=Mucilaginibacter sp. SP1R1 TaxID=2723091 RepID=UPI00161535E3|nr:hypothetical protein [Mucilaginibacter sp. SP1R1]MBB6149170.1 hypothetical protein [Mucilaginibacter sp. SP1R1]
MDYKDYLTIIPAPEHIDKKINLLKRSSSKHIGNFPGMYARAHISFDIIRDKIDSDTKKPLTLKSFYELIGLKIGAIPVRELNICGFDFFTHGPNFRTIYAAVQLDEETAHWFNSIKQALRTNKKISPHITVARKIPTELFDTLWPYFQKIEYRDSFKAEGLTVLEKESGHTFNHYKEYIKLPFAKKAGSC